MKQYITDYDFTDVAAYLRLDEPNEIETAEIQQIMKSAVFYISSYTGLTEDQINANPTLTYAWLAVCGHMWEWRQDQVDKGAVHNELLHTILDMYAVNLVPQVQDDEESESDA